MGSAHSFHRVRLTAWAATGEAERDVQPPLAPAKEEERSRDRSASIRPASSARQKPQLRAIQFNGGMRRQSKSWVVRSMGGGNADVTQSIQREPNALKVSTSIQIRPEARTAILQ